MKKLVIILGLAVGILLGCAEVTPSPSPIATPTWPPSPLLGGETMPLLPEEGGDLMTAEELASVAGMVFSLVFSYVPGVRSWFEDLQSEEKQLVMGTVLLCVALGAFGLSCAGVIDSATCDQAGAVDLVRVLVAALVANQATFLISPKRKE